MSCVNKKRGIAGGHHKYNSFFSFGQLISKLFARTKIKMCYFHLHPIPRRELSQGGGFLRYFRCR